VLQIELAFKKCRDYQTVAVHGCICWRSRDRVPLIADALVKQIRVNDTLDAVMGALLDLLTFALRSMCADCRCRQAAWLKANADMILAAADRQAKEIPPDPCNNHSTH
jgi:hypothetical protein